MIYLLIFIGWIISGFLGIYLYEKQYKEENLSGGWSLLGALVLLIMILEKIKPPKRTQW